MNYSGKKIAITGAHGFIGNELTEKLMSMKGVYVDVLEGDIRKPETFAGLDHDYDYLFHFASPSSQVQFVRDPSYCIETTVKGFMNAADACKKNGIRFIYPSTGLLSSGRFNEYAMCKKLCEDYVKGLNMDALGVRIFATYGPGEGHKRDYASVPYLFARDMIARKKPVIFGDGKQVRDFIYIDDVVNAILVLAEEASEPIVDIGSGENISFNSVVEELNMAIFKGKIEPVYINKPQNYVDETHADITILKKYYKPKIDIKHGLKELVKELEK